MADAFVDPVADDGPFFRRIDWSAFWTACLISFGVYAYTMCPTVGLEDSGELAVAGDYLGVPHPPGYPIWTLFSWLFARIFSFVLFRGQPNPAWGVTFVSVVAGALAAGVGAMLICRSGADLLRESREDSHSADKRTDNLICWIGGVVSSLLFAFSPVMWSQAVIVEVYSLGALFLALVFLFTYQWMRRPCDKTLYLAAFVFGLGLTNYQVLLLAALALAILIMLKDIDLFRDMLIVGISFVVTVVILKLAATNPMPGFPRHPVFAGETAGFIASHTPLLLAPATYGWILLTLSFVVVMCVVARQAWRGNNPPMTPLILLGLGVLVLIMLLLGVPSATPIAATPNQPVFSWAPYLLGFAASMAAIALLASLVPRGHLLAVALISVNLTLAVLLKKGALLGLYHPLSLWFLFYMALNVLFLGLGWLFLPRGRTVALSILLTEIGLAFYGFMPVVSDLRNPPMNWAYPRTWEGFKHAITRGQYEKIAPANVFSPIFAKQIGAYLTDLREEFTLPVALLGFLTFTVWRIRVGVRQIKALHVAIALSVVATAFVMVEKLLLPGVPLLSMVYRTLIFVVLLAMAAGGIALFVSQGWELIARLPAKAGRPSSERLSVALVLLGALTLYFLYATMLILSIASVTEPLRTGIPVEGVTPSDMVTQAMVLGVLAIAPVVLFALFTWLMRSRLRFNVIIDHTSQQWIIATLFGFLAMSIVLIALANPKGDIQDAFIQRVKFISSHALFGFWIGYGLIFGLAFVDTLFRGRPGRRGVVCLSMATALCLPLIPLRENAVNEELLRRYGGAEQNGHDYGWQFGNYQLRGADAVTEELGEDEEPLPDPFYPPPMTEDAIFFGGTDPGRFVPTYMIYSARVREDVYLITQNALADNTYMSVMRDLYGDQIWIPAQPDSAKAFQRYVDEVQSGKRPRNAELTIEHGRVQVSGALGVMEINGILAEMIFEHNNYRHDFYVEESYVIPWMYPYMTPHGLIMKINREQTPLDDRGRAADQEFWDWYVRRLMSDNRFLRDVVARKSFSKLRSAIGGLYANRMQLKDAEMAFHQARLLYPLSPEANFRLVQEVLMRDNRFADAKAIMTDYNRQDPGNTRVPDFIGYLTRIETLTQRIRELEARRTEGRIDLPSALELSGLYLQIGQKSLFLQMLRGIIGTPKVDARTVFEAASSLHKVKEYEEMDRALRKFLTMRPPNPPAAVFLNMARMYADANRPDRMNEAIEEYLKLQPDDWKAWLDQASLLIAMRRTEDAVRSLEQALRLGGQEAAGIVQQDPRFAAIRHRAMDRSRLLMGLPPGGGSIMPNNLAPPPGG